MEKSHRDHPTFLGIGAARSGTTWIDKQLRRSPSVWMPRRKELHYFTRADKYPSSSHLADSSLAKRLFSLSDHNRRFKYELIKAFGRNLLHPNAEQFAWDIKYFLGTYDDEWYLSLFRHKSDYVTGEITPAYSLLDDSDLQNLRLLLPNLKLIFIMRNPVDRAWSTIRYHEMREHKNLTKMSKDEIVSYLNRNAITSRSDYIDIVDKWERFYPKEQIFTCFYDEISQAPAELLKRLTEFLEIRDIPLSKENMNKKINKSIDASMPNEIRISLHETYQEQIKELSDRFGGYASNWLNEVENSL